jgi:endoglucanase
MLPSMSRRRVLALPALLLAGHPGRAAGAPPPPPLPPTPGIEEWHVFRARFIAADGRVVDTGNDGISHSEGQGWAMLLAEWFDDRVTFDLVLGWTRRILARRGDALHAWRYNPGAATPVDDLNNATDGDLMIAWALLRAARRWGGAEYGPLGTATARDILRLLLRPVAGRLLLLPGVLGFEHREHVVVNPSYYAFPAFRLLAVAVPDPLWLQLAGDGIALLRQGRFGRWGLPPDWLAVPRAGGASSLPRDRPPRFSYDAIRVPLYMTWAGLADEPAVTGAVRFWREQRRVPPPAWADLSTDALAPYEAPAGVVAVSRLARAAHAERELISNLSSIVSETDYYSAVLSLLCRMAWQDSGGRAG